MKNFYVYSDEGVCARSLEGCVSFLRQSDDSRVHTIQASDMIAGDWMNSADVFVVPGGRDIPYTQKLNGAGNYLIQEYVREGGVYLGICAGAYYASSYVNFAKGTDIEVCGHRELGFFPGTAEGPLVPYEYNSESGARFVDIRWLKDSQITETYYNGGCYFINAEQFPNVAILASYQTLAPQQPAIIQCLYGKGRAILSGVHIEHANEGQYEKHNYFLSLFT